MIVENWKDFNFHPALKDIENMFWVFILSNFALTNPSIQNIIKLTKEPSMVPILEKYNKWIELRTEIDTKKNTYVSKANLSDSIIFMGKAMAILTYDFLLVSKYFNHLDKLDEFKFLKYIRNGAAHYNKFNIKDENGNWKLGEGEKIKCFLDKEISRELHGKKVFNDFISMNHVFLLANYFSEELKKIDKKSNKINEE
jgi:hypothetical protein